MSRPPSSAIGTRIVEAYTNQRHRASPVSTTCADPTADTRCSHRRCVPHIALNRRELSTDDTVDAAVHLLVAVARGNQRVEVPVAILKDAVVGFDNLALISKRLPPRHGRDPCPGPPTIRPAGAAHAAAPHERIPRQIYAKIRIKSCTPGSALRARQRSPQPPQQPSLPATAFSHVVPRPDARSATEALLRAARTWRVGRLLRLHAQPLHGVAECRPRCRVSSPAGYQRRRRYLSGQPSAVSQAALSFSPCHSCTAPMSFSQSPKRRPLPSSLVHVARLSGSSVDAPLWSISVVCAGAVTPDRHPEARFRHVGELLGALVLILARARRSAKNNRSRSRASGEHSAATTQGAARGSGDKRCIDQRDGPHSINITAHAIAIGPPPEYPQSAYRW